MDLDACEKSDVGDQYPEIRQHLMDRLDYYQLQAAPLLIVAGQAMNIEEFDPQMTGGDFWGPYHEYDQCAFEDILEKHYQDTYPEDTYPELEKSSKTRSQNVLESGGKISTMGQQEMVSKLVLAVLSIGLVVMLYFIGRYCYVPKAHSPMGNEVAPLLAKV